MRLEEYIFVLGCPEVFSFALAALQQRCFTVITTKIGSIKFTKFGGKRVTKFGRKRVTT